MDTKLMTETARAMVAPGKGLLAADESAGTCKKRFDSVNVECTEENRRVYRELLFTTPGIEQYVSGVILFDETLRQKTKDGVNFAEYLKGKGIIPGIKVDAGAQDMALHPGEKVTEGLDKLAERMDEYFKLGARFAKWRAVITIGEGIPSARVHQGQRPRARALLGDLPGSLHRADRRARGAARRQPLRRAQRARPPGHAGSALPRDASATASRSST